MPEFTDLVVFRPSSVASVNSRVAVPDSAIVQQPKILPSVCLLASQSVVVTSKVLSSTITRLPSRAAGLPNAAGLYRHNQPLCHLVHPSPSLSPALHMHTPQQQADPSTLLSALRSPPPPPLCLSIAVRSSFSSPSQLHPPQSGALPSPTLPSTGLRSRDPGMRSGKRHVSFAEGCGK